MEAEQLQETWKTHFELKAKGEKDIKITNKLVEHYYYIVRNIADRLHQKITEVQRDELTSMGVDGLYDAIRAYDTSYNTKFETYAGPRIRGSMLDAIRKADWVPRLVRSKCNILEKQRSIIESEAGRKLTNPELADKLKMTEEDFEVLIRSTITPAMHSVNEMNSDNDESSITIEHVEDTRLTQPINDIMRREFFAKLMGLNYTPQERKIIWLYYYEDRSMKEISELVDLSESRVSQMHSKILNRLKNTAERNPVYIEDIWTMLPRLKGGVEVA